MNVHHPSEVGNNEEEDRIFVMGILGNCQRSENRVLPVHRVLWISLANNLLIGPMKGVLTMSTNALGNLMRVKGRCF